MVKSVHSMLQHYTARSPSRRVEGTRLAGCNLPVRNSTKASTTTSTRQDQIKCMQANSPQPISWSQMRTHHSHRYAYKGNHDARQCKQNGREKHGTASLQHPKRIQSCSTGCACLKQHHAAPGTGLSGRKKKHQAVVSLMQLYHGRCAAGNDLPPMATAHTTSQKQKATHMSYDINALDPHCAAQGAEACKSVW